MDKLELKLAPKAQLTYCRPPTLGSKLFNYKQISKDTNEKKTTKSMKKCQKCGLCGHFGKLNNMVKELNLLETNQGKRITINRKKNLTCRSYGIYVGLCNLCSNHYVGQTKNSFSTRWNAHRATWRKYYDRFLADNTITTTQNDEQALFNHYVNHHQEHLTAERIPLNEAYSVVFLEEPRMEILDVRESFWITKLDAKINISKTFLPKIK